jgi:biotin carboxyl carrier protein
MQYEVEVGGKLRQVHVHRAGGRFVVGLDGREWTVDAARINPHLISLLVDERSHEVTVAADPVSGQLAVGVDGMPVALTINGRRRWGRKDDGAGTGSGPQKITAPMPGKIARIVVKIGDSVLPRQPLVTMEAMKMENELRASRAGVVAELHVREGQSVDAGTLLLVVAPA